MKWLSFPVIKKPGVYLVLTHNSQTLYKYQPSIVFFETPKALLQSHLVTSNSSQVGAKTRWSEVKSRKTPAFSTIHLLQTTTWSKIGHCSCNSPLLNEHASPERDSNPPSLPPYLYQLSHFYGEWCKCVKTWIIRTFLLDPLGWFVKWNTPWFCAVIEKLTFSRWNEQQHEGDLWHTNCFWIKIQARPQNASSFHPKLGYVNVNHVALYSSTRLPPKTVVDRIWKEPHAHHMCHFQKKVTHVGSKRTTSLRYQSNIWM